MGVPSGYTSAQVVQAVPVPSGVLQVVSTSKTDTFSTAATSYTDVTGMSVTITPSSASSKILILVNFMASNSGNLASMYQLVRGSTAISIGDAAGSRTRASASLLSVVDSETSPQNIQFLDSPSTTSATTYKLQMFINSGTGYINRTGLDNDASTRPRTASNITVMEVKA